LIKASTIVFAVATYLLFTATFIYFLFFMSNTSIGHSVDAKPPMNASTFALLFDFLLILPFCLTHSVMARPWFKRLLARHLPAQLERGVYVMVSSITLLLLCRFYQPVEPVIWDLGSGAQAQLLRVLFWCGAGLVIAASFAIDHFSFTGVRQAWTYANRGRPARDRLREPLLYRLVRHPIQLGVLLLLWSAPTMSLGHLFLSISLTCYIMLALQLEERDLINTFGAEYLFYRERVPMLIPFTRTPKPVVSGRGRRLSESPSLSG